jgi:uncharacterized protein (TIGR02118 family)
VIQPTVLYSQPRDTAAFDYYYQETKAAQGQEIHGIKGFVINKPASLNPQQPSPYYPFADLSSESMAALQS